MPRSLQFFRPAIASSAFVILLSLFPPFLNGQSVPNGALKPDAAEISSPTEPEWVVNFPVDLEKLPANAEAAGGTYFLLSEKQYDLESRTTYYRYLKRFNTESALQDGSQLSIGFDPAYQTLRYHRLKIHRKGESLDRLPTQEFKLIQREKDHERQLYDSSLSAIALIEDTRVGDIVEYAFSITGSNPVFGEHFYWALTTSHTDPVGYIHGVFRQPSARAVKFVQNATDFAPTVSESENTTTQRWTIENPEPLPDEGGTPGDYDPWGWIEASSFKSWQEVTDWALEQYVIPDEIPGELDAILEKTAVLGSNEEKVLSALRFVQDEIRYLGIFEGVHSHKPHPLATITRRRFGDCKDKTLLLVSLLRKTGIEAYPALVRSDYRKAIHDWTPSPQAFDHLVTCVVLDGKQYWLDPTRSYQRGSLNDLFFPDFGFALVLRKGEKALTGVGKQGFDASRTRIREVFRLKDYLGEARLEVESRYSGASADSMRSYFASASPAEIGRSYLNYYSSTYDEIEISTDVSVEDDEATNTFTVRESYLIPNLWQEKRDDDQKFEATFNSNYVYDRIGIPSTKKRTMPFSLGHPVDVEHEVAIHMPGPMNEEDTKVTVDDPAFRFDYRETFEGPVTRLFFAYKSFADRVEAERMPEYLKNARKAEDHTSYSMLIGRNLHEGKSKPVPDEVPYAMNWPIVIVMLLGGLGSAILCLFAWFWKPNWSSGPGFDPNLDGIAGWLVLVALGLCIQPLTALAGIVQVIEGNDFNHWKLLVIPGGSAYHALWAPLLILEAVVAAAIFPMSVFLLVLFFRRHYTFPRYRIFSLGLIAVTQWLLFAMMSAIPSVGKDNKAEVFGAAITVSVQLIVWWSYFRLSVRVATTFRNGMPKSAVALPPPLPAGLRTSLEANTSPPSAR